MNHKKPSRHFQYLVKNQLNKSRNCAELKMVHGFSILISCSVRTKTMYINFTLNPTHVHIRPNVEQGASL